MKIHIVRKGDTLWEIAQQYGVDFEELKQFNPQLSSPDMIMPGMKIKIPSASKAVKKETVSVKEAKIPVPKEQPKQTPIIKEDDHEKPKEVKLEMPKKYTPETPYKPQAPKKEVATTKKAPKAPMKPMKEVPITKKVPKSPVKPMKEMIKMPVMEEMSLEKLPKPPQPKKPKEVKVDHQLPVMPIYHHYYHHCCSPAYHHCFPVMGEMSGGFMPHQHMHQMPIHQTPMHHMPLQQQHMMQSDDCGCHGTTPQFPQHHMREQMPTPFPVAGLAPFVHQPNYENQPIEPNFREIPSFPPDFNHGLHVLNEKPFPMPPGYPVIPNLNHQEDKRERRMREDETTSE